MIKVLFVCHGNICRSPMAQYVFQNLVRQKGLEDYFEIDSAGTSSEELGNPVYPPAVRILKLHGIEDIAHRARKMTEGDYRHFHLIEVMDSYNLRNAVRMTLNDPDGKIAMLLGDEIIGDPWYTGDFAGVYNQIERGCRNLLNEILSYEGFSLETATDRKVFAVYARLFDAWCLRTCAPRMQDRWTGRNRTLGQCSVTAFLVQDCLGGDVYGTALADGSIHCFNVINGKLYDLAVAQLKMAGIMPDYSKAVLQDRGVHFAKQEKYERYLLLKERFGEFSNIY